MSTTGLRWAAAALTCLGGGLVAASPAGAVAGSHNHPAAKHSHPKGFFVANQQGTTRVTKSLTPSALVEDDNGTQHILTTAKSPSSPGNMGHIVYLTRQRSATTYKTHDIPGLIPLAGNVQIEEGLSTDGRRVYGVFYQCNGVFVADASLHTTRFPVPSPVAPADNCAAPTPTDNRPPIAHAVAMDSHKIGILLPDPAQGNNPAIWVGQPGGEPFTPGTALPTSDSFVPEQITRDAYNGDITAVGYGSDGTNEGVYVTTLGRFASTWTTPTLVATLHSPTSDYVIQALSTYQGSKYVGLLRPLGAVSHPKASLFVVHGNKSGQFTGVIALPHSTVQDTELRLATNPETGHLHAAFTRQVPSSKTKRSGILQEARGDNGWNKPTVYTHWYRDFADQITFNVVGKAVIGYDQR